MKLDDVLTLARAGYSANQIAQFAQLEKQVAQAGAAGAAGSAQAGVAQAGSAQAGAAQAGSAQAGAAQAGSAQAGAAQAGAHNFNDIYQMIAGIRDDIHAGNLLNASQAGAAQPSADDIIANIINPKNDEGGNK